MPSQLAGTILHVFWNYILVNKLELGVVGTGLSGLATNLFLLVVTIWQTAREPELEQALKVSIFNWQVYDQWRAYLSISIPNTLIIFFDWSTFEVMTLMAGYLGVH